MQTIKTPTDKQNKLHNYNLLGEFLDNKNRFFVEEKISKGSFGSIYKVYDNILKKSFAIKIFFQKALLKTKLKGFDNILFEAKILSKLNHPNIIKCLFYGVDKRDNLFMVMEYIDGLNFREWIRLNYNINLNFVKKIIGFMIQILDALNYIHIKNIIHRDIKPENIMISNNKAILLDFGIAKTDIVNNLIDDKYTMIFSTHYAPPDQTKFYLLDYKSDIFSLGVVFYEALTMHIPNIELNYNIIPPNEFLNLNLPKELDDIILNMLAYNSSDRKNAKEVITILKKILLKMG